MTLVPYSNARVKGIFWNQFVFDELRYPRSAHPAPRLYASQLSLLWPPVIRGRKGTPQELVRLLIAEGLVTLGTDRVVVVAARRALAEYLRYGA